MKNKNGFTLVELLAAVVILGIITAISFPLLKRFSDTSENRRFGLYGDSLKDLAKSYVDAYGTDLFPFEYAGAEQETKYACITVDMLEKKKIFKDIKYENFSCKTDNTFIKVTKSYKLKNPEHNTYDTYYTYDVYLGCGVMNKDTYTVNDITIVKTPDGNLHSREEVCP